MDEFSRAVKATIYRLNSNNSCLSNFEQLRAICVTLQKQADRTTPAKIDLFPQKRRQI
jgi:hypothetical protein